MSSFGGKTAEIERLSIDRFDGDNLLSTCFMLSHCHTDHMEGIREPRFLSRLRDCPDVYLYCSAITATILKHAGGLASVAHKISVLPVEDSSIVRVPAARGEEDDEIAVTLIPAGHCPGSVMFLLECARGVLLYTGDFRLVRGDVAKLRSLHNGDGRPKQLDTLYLDTTFLTVGGRTSFPTRDDSAIEVCRLIQDWIRRGERYVVNIKTSARYGSEFLFVEIAKQVGQPVHVSPALFHVYRQIPDIAHAVTDNPQTQLHACRAKENHCSRLCDSLFEIRKITPSALYWYSWPEVGPISVVQGYGGRRCRVAYSCHSSHEEIEHVVEYLRPSRIEPCVVPQWMTREDVVGICNTFLNGYRHRPSDAMGQEMASLPVIGRVLREACNVQRFKTDTSDEDNDSSDQSPVSSPPRRHCRSRSWSPGGGQSLSPGKQHCQTQERNAPSIGCKAVGSGRTDVGSSWEDNSPISSPERSSAQWSVLPRRLSTQSVSSSQLLLTAPADANTINSSPTMSCREASTQANKEATSQANKEATKEAKENGYRNSTLYQKQETDNGRLLKKLKVTDKCFPVLL